MNDAKRLYRYLLVALGASVGTLGTSLAFEVAPSLVRFKDGIDPMVQGSLVGGSIVLLLGLTVAMVEVGHE